MKLPVYTKSPAELARLQKGMEKILEDQAKVPVLKPASDHLKPAEVKRR